MLLFVEYVDICVGAGWKFSLKGSQKKSPYIFCRSLCESLNDFLDSATKLNWRCKLESKRTNQ